MASLNDLMYAYFGGQSSISDAMRLYYLQQAAAGITGQYASLGAGFAKQSWAGTNLPNRGLNRWKSKAKPAIATLNGAIIAGTTAVPVNSFDGFQPGVKYRAIVESEEVFVSAGFGTVNQTWIRGVNGTTPAAHASGIKVLNDAIIRVAVLGDSTVEGVSGGGADGWPAKLARLLSRILAVPNLSPGTLGSGGYYPVFRNNDANIGGGAANSATEWTCPGGAWTLVAAGGGTDRGPFGWAVEATGTANVLKFTPPGNLGDIKCIDVHYVNSVPNGWSFSTDGGGSWTDGPGTGSAPGGGRVCLARVTLGTPITDFRIRAGTAGGAATTPKIIGVDCWATAPVFGSTVGVKVYNIGKDSDFLSTFNRTNASGDNFAFLDPANSDMGAIDPDLVIIGPFTNDVILGNWSTTAPGIYQTNLTAVVNRLLPRCDVMLMAMSEQGAPRSSTDQATLRSTLHTVASTLGVPYLDLYDAFAGEGYTGFTACDTLGGTVASGSGLMVDSNHLSQLGHVDAASRLARLLVAA